MNMRNTNRLDRDGEGGATYLPKEETRISFPPDRTALLVIDPVNDFLSKGGAGWEMTKTTVKMNDVVDHLKRAIEGVRPRDIPILFGPMAYTEEDYADEQLQRRSGINRLMFEKKMFLAGSWGQTFIPTCSHARMIRCSCRIRVVMFSRPTSLNTSGGWGSLIW